MALEEFKVFDVNILEILDFEEIEALLELGNTDYGENTCFDYIDSIKKIGDKYRVVIFVEPVGNISFAGNNLLKLLKFLKELFLKQPADMSYVDAGYHLLNFLQEKIDGSLFPCIDVNACKPEEILKK